MAFRIVLPLYDHIDREGADELAGEATLTLGLAIPAEVHEVSEDFPELLDPMDTEEIHALLTVRLAQVHERMLGGPPIQVHERHPMMLGIAESWIERATREVPGFGAWLRGNALAFGGNLAAVPEAPHGS